MQVDQKVREAAVDAVLREMHKVDFVAYDSRAAELRAKASRYVDATISALSVSPAPDWQKAAEALNAVRPILVSLISAEYNVETWGLNGRLAAVDAALRAASPSLAGVDQPMEDLGNGQWVDADPASLAKFAAPVPAGTQEPVASPFGYVSPNLKLFAKPDAVDGGYLLRHGWTAVYAAPPAPDGWRATADAKIDEALQQLDINVSIAERDHPEGVVVDGKRISALPHSQAILAGHIRDRLNELRAILPTKGEA